MRKNISFLKLVENVWINYEFDQFLKNLAVTIK